MLFSQTISCLAFCLSMRIAQALTLWKPSSEDDYTPFLREPTPSLPFDTRQPQPLLGFTGSDLINYFKSSVSIESMDRGGTSENVKVSYLYDRVAGYLRIEDPAQTDSVNSCNPDRSIVARITRGVQLVGKAHAHNDYWHDLPLLEAMAHGVTSVEADVWLYNNNTALAVGHNKGYLNPEHHDLGKLYLSPLMRMLDEVNCHMDTGSPLYGLFFDSPEESLLLYIDFKPVDKRTTYRVLLEYLAPLAERGYLTYYDSTSHTLLKGPITIILTGNYPEEDEMPTNEHRRYTFVDAPLNLLESKKDSYSAGEVSLVASASLKELMSACNEGLIEDSVPAHFYNPTLSEEETLCLAKHIALAHDMGLKTRIWGVPQWPLYVRNYLWQQQLALGVDYLNVDDLAGIASF